MHVILCLLISLLLSTPAVAKPVYVSASTSISNGDWYPLPQPDMKAAAVDAALAELTQSGHFVIFDPSAAGQLTDGDLHFGISLVGPAEVVKLTITLQLPKSATYVASVSLDIHGMDYQGIYKAFEFVGTEAARRLNAKLALAQEPVATHSPSPDLETAALYDHAQQLKRKGKYSEARALYERIAEQDSESDSQWRAMASDELRFGLPMFEANSLLFDNTLGDALASIAKLVQVGHLYRQILADNAHDPQRVMEMHRRLDDTFISRKALDNVVRANSLNAASPLRVTFYEYFMSTGAWPDEATAKKELETYAPSFEVVTYRIDSGQLELVLRDTRYGSEVQVFGTEAGVTLKAR